MIFFFVLLESPSYYYESKKSYTNDYRFLFFYIQYTIGLFDINESKTKDMIQLLKMMSSKYVPTFVSLSGEVEVAEPIFFG